MKTDGARIDAFIKVVGVLSKEPERRRFRLEDLQQRIEQLRLQPSHAMLLHAIRDQDKELLSAISSSKSSPGGIAAFLDRRLKRLEWPKLRSPVDADALGLDSAYYGRYDELAATGASLRGCLLSTPVDDVDCELARHHNANVCTTSASRCTSPTTSAGPSTAG